LVVSTVIKKYECTTMAGRIVLTYLFIISYDIGEVFPTYLISMLLLVSYSSCSLGNSVCPLFKKGVRNLWFD